MLPFGCRFTPGPVGVGQHQFTQEKAKTVSTYRDKIKSGDLLAGKSSSASMRSHRLIAVVLPATSSGVHSTEWEIPMDDSSTLVVESHCQLEESS